MQTYKYIHTYMHIYMYIYRAYAHSVASVKQEILKTVKSNTISWQQHDETTSVVNLAGEQPPQGK